MNGLAPPALDRTPSAHSRWRSVGFSSETEWSYCSCDSDFALSCLTFTAGTQLQRSGASSDSLKASLPDRLMATFCLDPHNLLQDLGLGVLMQCGAALQAISLGLGFTSCCMCRNEVKSNDHQCEWSYLTVGALEFSLRAARTHWIMQSSCKRLWTPKFSPWRHTPSFSQSVIDTSIRQSC